VTASGIAVASTDCYPDNDFRKIAKSDFYLRHVCSFVRPSAWKNSARNGLIFMKFDILVFFEKLWEEFKLH
jgi:hypothetical protein